MHNSIGLLKANGQVEEYGSTAGGGSGYSFDISTTPKKIGTWIDGKDLYMQYVEIGAITDGTTGKTVNHNIPNVDFISVLFGGLCDADGYYDALPKIGTEFTYSYGVYADRTVVQLKVGSGNNYINSFVVVLFTQF